MSRHQKELMEQDLKIPRRRAFQREGRASAKALNMFIMLKNSRREMCWNIMSDRVVKH